MSTIKAPGLRRRYRRALRNYRQALRRVRWDPPWGEGVEFEAFLTLYPGRPMNGWCA